MNKNILSKQIIHQDKKYLYFNLTNTLILDFQLDIINNNEEWFIGVEKFMEDENINIKYDIEDYISLIEYLEVKEMSKSIISNILCRIAYIVICSYDFSLSSNNNILDLNNIFINKYTEKLKLINLPLNDKYIKNINKSYMDMVDTLIKYVLVNSRIKTGNAEELIHIRDSVKADGLEIIDFATMLHKNFKNEVEEYRSQIIAEETKIATKKATKSSSLIENKINNRIGENKKMIESNKKSPMPPAPKSMPPKPVKQNNTQVKQNNISSNQNLSSRQKQPLATRTVPNSTRNLGQDNMAKQMNVNNSSRNNNVAINSNIDINNRNTNNNNYYGNMPNIKQKTQFKTSRIVASIIMQPIMIGLMLLSFLVIAKTNTQAIGLCVFIAAIDIFVLAILLNPNKKEVVGEEVVPQQSFTNRPVYKEAINEIVEEPVVIREEEDLEDEFEVEREINIIDELDDVFTDNSTDILIDEETNILEEETDLLDEETSLIEEVEPVILPDYLLEVDNNEIIENIEVIHNENYVIGRQAQLQNYISNTGVSRRHVEIFKENDEFYIRDLKSKNGTRLNNIRMASGEEKKLNDNDVIEIPDLAITFKLISEEQVN